MPRQEITIGAPDREIASFGFLEWWPDLPLSAELIQGGLSAELSLFRVRSNGLNTCQLLGEGDSRGGFPGPDFTSEVEDNPSAFTIRAGDIEIVLPGPNAGASQDPTEPYSWSDDVVTLAQVQAYIDLPGPQKAETVLIIDSGVSKAFFRGSIETGVPVLSARVVAFQPPELYCLDPDNASTTGVLARGENGIKIFLELADELSGLFETLPDDQTARPLLTAIPEISIDDSFFRGAGDVTFRLDNRRGNFDDDQVGRFVQLWGLSYGREKRLLFIGRVSSQSSSPLESVLTASDLPVEALQREIPARSVDQSRFPNSRVPGVPVPVVFGRALRMRCPHLSPGIKTVLYNAAVVGDTEIFVSKVAGIAVGDKLSFSPGEAEAETGIVESIDRDEPSITLSAALTNAHAEDAVVSAADIVEDYLLGEGRWSGGNFTKIFRVYYNERALPEFTCLDRRPSATLASGDHNFKLDSQHRVQFADWYRNYFIEFIDEDGVTAGSSIIRAYNPADNTVSINLSSAAADYTCYRMREYRFFDGSQDTPHGGFAFLRLARKYQGEIRADVQGFDLTDPSEIIKECLTNETWGAGETLDFVVENDIENYDFEGALTARRRIADIVSEVGKFRPLRLLREREQMTLRYHADAAAVEMPGEESAYISPPVIQRSPLDHRRAAIAVRYRPDLRENETSQEVVESPGGVGANGELDLFFVYEMETADRVAYHEGQRELSLRRQVEFEVDPRDVSDEIFPGMKVKIPAGLAGSENTDWIVSGVRRRAETSLFIAARQYRQGLFSYPADRLLLAAEDTYDPPVDFSETPPEPLRNFRAVTETRMDGDNELFECTVSFTPPKENYSTAEIWFALGADEPYLRTEEDPANPGKARFDLPLELQSYRVVGYSVSENGRLRGYPVEVSVNQTPTADAGDDRAVAAGANVTLDGSGSSDPDNDDLTYLWEQLSGTPVVINNATSEMATFTAPSTSSTHVLEFQLTVSDGKLESVDSVVINVRAYSPPPPIRPVPGKPGGAAQDVAPFAGWRANFSAPTSGGITSSYQVRSNQAEFSGVSDWEVTERLRWYLGASYTWIELRACNAYGCGPARRLTQP